MRSVLKTIGAFVLIVAGLIGLFVAVQVYNWRAFGSHWERRFLEGGAKAAAALPAVDLAVGLPGETPAPPPVDDAKLIRKVFPDGSWFIVAEHDSHDGGEWDRAVFYDSRGRIEKTSHHFCSWEGLLGGLRHHAEDAATVDDFFKSLRKEVQL